MTNDVRIRPNHHREIDQQYKLKAGLPGLLLRSVFAKAQRLTIKAISPTFERYAGSMPASYKELFRHPLLAVSAS